MKDTKQLDLFKKDKPLVKDTHDLKICYICKDSFPLDGFPWSDGGKKWHRRECKDCYSKLTRDRYYLKKNRLLPDDTYTCPICSIGAEDSVGKKTVWNLDHCHDTKKFRDYLCSTCNTGLGFFKDEIVLLNKAITYLNTHKENL